MCTDVRFPAADVGLCDRLLRVVDMPLFNSSFVVDIERKGVAKIG
jgi:hypothetical protein